MKPRPLVFKTGTDNLVISLSQTVVLFAMLARTLPLKDGPSVPDSSVSHPDFSFTYSLDPGLPNLGCVMKSEGWNISRNKVWWDCTVYRDFYIAIYEEPIDSPREDGFCSRSELYKLLPEWLRPNGCPKANFAWNDVQRSAFQVSTGHTFQRDSGFSDIS